MANIETEGNIGLAFHSERSYDVTGIKTKFEAQIGFFPSCGNVRINSASFQKPHTRGAFVYFEEEAMEVGPSRIILSRAGCCLYSILILLELIGEQTDSASDLSLRRLF